MFTIYSTVLRKVLIKSRACCGGVATTGTKYNFCAREKTGEYMGKRSDRRKFRRRRRWAGFILLVSFALLVFGVQFLAEIGSPDLQTAASRTAEKVGVQRVEAPDVADAPEAVGKQTADEVALLASEEEDVKSPAEKTEVEQEAVQKADEKQEAAKQEEQQSQKQDDPQQ